MIKNCSSPEIYLWQNKNQWPPLSFLLQINLWAGEVEICRLHADRWDNSSLHHIQQEDLKYCRFHMINPHVSAMQQRSTRYTDKGDSLNSHSNADWLHHLFCLPIISPRRQSLQQSIVGFASVTWHSSMQPEHCSSWEQMWHRWRNWEERLMRLQEVGWEKVGSCITKSDQSARMLWARFHYFTVLCKLKQVACCWLNVFSGLEIWSKCVQFFEGPRCVSFHRVEIIFEELICAVLIAYVNCN